MFVLLINILTLNILFAVHCKNIDERYLNAELVSRIRNGSISLVLNTNREDVPATAFIFKLFIADASVKYIIMYILGNKEVVMCNSELYQSNPFYWKKITHF